MTYSVLVDEISIDDNSNRNSRTYVVTVTNKCHLLTMSSQALPNVAYTAGDPEITIMIPDFVASPTNFALICPSIVHEYTHTPNHDNLISESKSLRMSSSAGVSISTITVTVTQKVPYALAFGAYASASTTFDIIINTSSNDPCESLSISPTN